MVGAPWTAEKFAGVQRTKQVHRGCLPWDPRLEVELRNCVPVLMSHYLGSRIVNLPEMELSKKL